MMRKHQQHKYGLAATAMSLLATVPVSAQVQELDVQRDTIPTYLKVQNKGIVNNALDVLNGNAAGVNVTSNGMDRMAQLSSVRVRGTTSIIGGNDPLVIIDGVTSDIATLSTIYPADIESFSVLKNAAETALYGSRGASGVIEVKTKKGTGKGFQISYETNIGMERMSKKLDMLSAGEYLATAKKLGVYANNGGHDNNFYDVITRTGFVQNHYLAFSGGSEQSNYRASFGYIDHNTIIKTKDYNNFVAKIDVTQHAFDNRLKGDFGVFVPHSGTMTSSIRKCSFILLHARTRHILPDAMQTATGQRTVLPIASILLLPYSSREATRRRCTSARTCGWCTTLLLR